MKIKCAAIGLLLVLTTGQYSHSQEKITILHTNDIHGNFQASTNKDDSTKKYGGLIALNYYVQQVQNELDDNYLLFDAGDFMTGNPICDIEYEGAKGGALIYFLNYIGYDGLTLGNHEFDISVENCRCLIKSCQFPVFSSNLCTSDGQLFTPEGYHIYKKKNLRIGVIGIIVHELSGYLKKEQQEQIYSAPALPIVESIAERIDDETDLIIVLSHSGIDNDRLLAEQLSRRVDIIIGGHSHTKLPEPIKVNGKLIVQAASGCVYLGMLDIAVNADTVQTYNGKLLFLDTTSITPDSAFANEVNKFSRIIDQQYGLVIGELKTAWIRNSNGESNVGNFITDCIREKIGTDFAVINSGGVRQDLSAGPIKMIDIKRILPFSNQICTFEMSGQQIMNMINAHIHGDSGQLQVSGINYQWTTDLNNNPKLLDVKINGATLNINQIYQGASVDYVLANANRYLGMDSIVYQNLYIPMTDLIIETIKNKKIIHTEIEGRIIKR